MVSVLPPCGLPQRQEYLLLWGGDAHRSTRSKREISQSAPVTQLDLEDTDPLVLKIWLQKGDLGREIW